MVEIIKAILHGAGDLRLEQERYDLSRLPDDNVFVRTLVTGFSTGTDLGNYQGRSTEVPGAPSYPRSVGYSNVGVVEVTGSAVRHLKAGDRVFSTRPHQSAYVAAGTDLILRLPEGIALEQASLSYLTYLGVAALRQAKYQAGENVAVVGLGVIGLCTVAIACSMGAKVVAVANDAHRAQLARQLGAHEAYIASEYEPSQIFLGQGADVVVLTANTWEAYRDSLEMARRFGRVSILGFPGRSQPAPEFNPLDMRWLYGKQLTLAGAGHLPGAGTSPGDLRFDIRNNLAFILDRIASGDIDLSLLISHRFPYTDMQQAYELAVRHSKQLGAAVFLWS